MKYYFSDSFQIFKTGIANLSTKIGHQLDLAQGKVCGQMVYPDDSMTGRALHSD